VAREYLGDLINHDIDTLVLGCTHYPLLRDTIAETVGTGVTIIESGDAVAEVVEEILDSLGARAADGDSPRRLFLATDAPRKLARVGERFLGHPLDEVEWVDVK
jgi:glutamate racemase